MMIKEMILQLKARDYSIFDDFYNHTKKGVFYTISTIIKRGDLVEEIMQDTYIKFLDNIEKCDANNNPIAYLNTIARNLSINEYHKLTKFTISDEVFEVIDDTEESSISLGILEYLEGIEKEVVSLHIVSDLKFKDVAAVLNKPLGTVLWIYNKAIKKLKRKVGEHNEN